MAVTKSDLRSIQQMKKELSADLAALERVEHLLAHRNGNSTSASTTSPAQERKQKAGKYVKTIHASADSSKKYRGLLKQMIIDSVKAAGADGIRPKQVADIVSQRGYAFSAPNIGASIVSTALQRMLKHGQVDRVHGSYVWKEEAHKISA